ncbi:t-diRNAhydrouridine synthase [Cyathus striatus]|nr:t-diRNAhydrouridine synthase [Cyathus striatus]
MDTDHLTYIAAPMVKQSDLPFRILVRRYGATMAYTQMLIPEKLLNDQEYLEHHIRDLTAASNEEKERPVVVQLCGHEPVPIVRAGRKLQAYCDGIDLNLGCPQEAAREGHFGAYLLGQKDWPVVQDIVPVSAKLRLCQPTPKTVELAQNLEACGASWITLHARTVSARRRRHGLADLSEVKRLKEHLKVPIISNGNVREYNDLQENLQFTGADGLMVGESLLGNPCLFADTVPDPMEISLEYLDICKQYAEVVPLTTIQTHIRHFIDFQCNRRPWFSKFRTALNATQSLEEVEKLLRVKVQRWRGRPPLFAHHHGTAEGEDNDDSDYSNSDESDKHVDIDMESAEDTFGLSFLH